jgi:hypothetical protein
VTLETWAARERRALLERLRPVAVHLETAALLERRALASANPALATVLRERAREHRVAADRLRRAVLTPPGRARPAVGT